MAFAAIYAVILLLVTLAGIEFLASFFVPPWPARALRNMPPVNPVSSQEEPFKSQPWYAVPFNSWGMRDKERSIARPAGAGPRTVFVGDSFVESFTRTSLPATVEQQLASGGYKGEMINLGISATGPRSYYYRMRDVALALSPDQVLLFFYTGNDFMPPGRGFAGWPRLIDESAGGSLLGSVMPRTNWLLVSRLKLAESLKVRVPPNEFGELYRIVRRPPAERLALLVDHMKKTYAPPLPDAQIAEILGRGDNRFWNEMDSQPGDPELLIGWTLLDLLWREITPPDVTTEETERQTIEATMSWLLAARRLAEERGVPLKLFVIPVASIDPDYTEFWRPWPKSFAGNLIAEQREQQLKQALVQAGMPFIDLRPELNGLHGIYRKRDGHWTVRGQQIVGARIAREIQAGSNRE
jgi:hypothetical protein